MNRIFHYMCDFSIALPDVSHDDEVSRQHGGNLRSVM